MGTSPVGSYGCQAQAPTLGAQDLEVGHHDEGPDIERARAPEEQEAEQAGVPERPEHIEPRRQRGQPPQRVGATHDGDGDHQPSQMRADVRAPPQRQGAQIDHAVSRRDEPRDVLEAIDVHPEPAGERVLHRRGEHDDDDGLHPHQ